MHIEYLYYFRDFSKSLSISKTAAEYYIHSFSAQLASFHL